MQDRFADLVPNPGADVEMGQNIPPDASPYMQDFFDQVQHIKKTMGTIKLNIKSIEQ